MTDDADHTARFHRPRKPWETVLYRLFEKHFDEFEQVYPERFQTRYGFWRPVIRKAVSEYLQCGDPLEGFARGRCPDCRKQDPKSAGDSIIPTAGFPAVPFSTADH